ncbi:amidohydrolase [Lacticaseibacillus thailandensis]|uniref:amidohydrolase n=1 Tax=Lacticaseibacillus thailandensis TaxID=381741 RepID=UPI000B250702
MDLLATLMQQLDAAASEIIRIRRELHQHPEVSFHEQWTAAYIKRFYAGFDCPVTDYGDGYGFAVDIPGGQSGPTLALRADFDALAVQEDNDLPFKSQQPGVMHACGHDGHTAYMMVLARTLWQLRDQLPGGCGSSTSAEEVSPGGAQGMLAAGVLTGVDNVLGAHVMTSMPTGTVGYHVRETQTGRANFTVTVVGKGGHASMPHLANDASWPAVILLPRSRLWYRGGWTRLILLA